MIAAFPGDERVAELARKKATFFMAAAKFSSSKAVVTEFVNRGANIDAEDDFENSAVAYAKENAVDPYRTIWRYLVGVSEQHLLRRQQADHGRGGEGLAVRRRQARRDHQGVVGPAPQQLTFQQI